MPEPPRGGFEEQTVGAARRPGNPLLLVLRIRTMWWLILSGALHNFTAYALGAFLSPFLMRYHGLGVREAGWLSALGYGCGGLGLFLGGWACDRIVARRASGRLEVSAAALALFTICIFFALGRPPDQAVEFGAWFLPACFFMYVYYSGVYATVQDVVEPALRGTAMAMYFFAMYVLGAAFGSLITGWVSDYFARRAAALDGSATILPHHRAVGLHDALGLIPPLGALLVVVLLLGARTVRGDYHRLQQWMAATGKPQ